MCFQWSVQSIREFEWPSYPTASRHSINVSMYQCLHSMLNLFCVEIDIASVSRPVQVWSSLVLAQPWPMGLLIAKQNRKTLKCWDCLLPSIRVSRMPSEMTIRFHRVRFMDVVVEVSPKANSCTCNLVCPYATHDERTWINKNWLYSF